MLHISTDIVCFCFFVFFFDGRWFIQIYLALLRVLYSILKHYFSYQFNTKKNKRIHFVAVQSLIRARLFVTPWTTTCQDSVSCTISWRLLKLMSTELVMPSHPLSSFSCSQFFPASESFPMGWHQVAKVLEFQQLRCRTFPPP